MALIRNRHVVWTSCREPHLGSGHVRPRQQAGHMIASDPIRCCRHSCKPGAVHIWVSQKLDPTYEFAMTEGPSPRLLPILVSLLRLFVGRIEAGQFHPALDLAHHPALVKLVLLA